MTFIESPVEKDKIFLFIVILFLMEIEMLASSGIVGTFHIQNPHQCE